MTARATAVAGLLAAGIVALAVQLDGQTPAAVDHVTEPLRCWWRTSAGAVSVGELFDATITCAAREADPVRVVPDESRLQATAIQLAPFEVLSGSHPADLQTPTHRFFQYHYTLRIISPDVIGRDARFPDIQVHYRVHDRVAGDTVEGRDRVYLLPGQSVRVLSLVPVEADDIRDSSNADFGSVTSLRFRARGFRLAAALLGAMAVVLLASVALRAVRSAPVKQRSAALVEPRSILGEVFAELNDVKRQSAAGWTADLVARALAATRIAAATGLGQSLAQRKHASGTLLSPGSLMCTRGWLRRERFVVSSAMTPHEVERQLQQPSGGWASHRSALEQLQRSLSTQTCALYSASSALDGAALDDALREAIAATQSLRQVHAWPRAWFGSRTVSRSAQAEA